MNEYLFTSESVSEGHPDKVADQISDAVLDAILVQDSKARVAAETLAATNLVVLAGEITTSAKVDYENIARTVLKDIGYDDPAKGIDYKNCKVNVVYGQQSPDIAQGVNKALDDPLSQGAGDQGLMFGYACEETPTLMPMPIWLSHKIMKRQAMLRKNNTISWLRPDAKSQVTLKYEDNQPKAIDTIVVSTQHDPDISLKNIRDSVVEEIIKPEIPAEFKKDNIKFLVNPTGNFVIGGPEGDCGLTGRKIIVDTYGGAAPHGGGAFSGKDPSKVDRSAAYAARYVAKNIVASKLATRCLVQLSYAIGVAEPTSIMIDTFGTSKLNAYELEALVRAHFDLRPRGIVDMLDLLRPIYRQTAAYGHFGREDIELPWEKIDKILN